MWLGRFEIVHEDPLLEYSRLYDAASFGHVLSAYEEDGNEFHTIVQTVEGPDATKYIQKLAKHPSIKSIEIDGNQFFATLAGPFVAQKFSKKLFFLAPIQHKDGIETWTLGAIKRSHLTDFYKKVQTLGKIQIKELREIHVPTFVHAIVPNLTFKQKQAIAAAAEHGYYDYPRKVSVSNLANLLGTKRSTFQEHLRKAESKIMRNMIPYMGKTD